MTVSPDTTQAGARSHSGVLEAIAVYFKPRVLIVLLLGFSSGLPLALASSTLAVWLTESNVDIATIGLFSLIGLPYTFKFFWAPVVDALDVPVLSVCSGDAAAGSSSLSCCWWLRSSCSASPIQPVR